MSRLRRRDPILAAYDQFGGGTCQIGLVDAGFAKLRDFSIRFDVPVEWSEKFGASTASVTLSGPEPYHAVDRRGRKVRAPGHRSEVHATQGRPTYANVNAATHGMVAYIQDQWPTYQRIVLAVRTSF